MGFPQTLTVISLLSHLCLTGVFLASTSSFLGCQAQLDYESPEVNPFAAEKKIHIDKDGGYHVTLAIQTDTNEPLDVELLLQNIQEQFGNVSELLYEATEGTFFLATLNVIIPGHWSILEYEEENILPETMENYESAHVRMSRNSQGVHVHNSNPCGHPGHHIDLPIDFFRSSSESKYGPQHKALVVAWARFRWGVWEEYGYPGSQAFPYFYKDSVDMWKPTACSSEQLSGKILSIFGENANEVCSTDSSSYPPQSQCRFIPDLDQPLNPTSSLNYFSFLPSVTRFCDSTNHNPDAPNKQNLYCNYQSIQNVTHSTSDYVRVTNPLPPSSPVPSLNFTVTKQSHRPIFYLLVDSSKVGIPQPVLRSITEGVNSLFSGENDSIENVIGKAVTFSRVNVEWTRITNDIPSFETTTNEFEKGKEGPKSFSEPIENMVGELISRNHPYGAVALILKHGASSDSFGSEVYEADLITQLRDANIIVNAIEVRIKTIDPQLHLEDMARKSGGTYLSIDPSTPDKTGQVKRVIRNVNEQLTNFKKPSLTNSATLDKRFLFQGCNLSLPLHHASFPSGTEIQFSLTSLDPLGFNVDGSPFNITNGPEDHEVVLTKQSYEWNEIAYGNNRETVECTLKINSNHFEEPWEFQYNWEEAFLVIRYVYPPDFVTTSNPLTVIISSSAQGNQFAIDKEKEPLMVYATVAKDGNPVYGLDNVEVTLHSFKTQKSYGGYFLTDDGPNSVDIATGDGTYSGAIVPPEDGLFYLTFVVSGARLGQDSLVDYIHEDSAVHRLMHMDQKEIGCVSSSPGCPVSALERGTMQFVELNHPITISGVGSWEPKGAKVLDFTAEAIDGYRVQLEWRAPRIFTNEDVDESVLNYTIFRSSKPDKLRSDDDTDTEEVGFTGDLTFQPGQINSVIVDEGNNGYVYYAVGITIEGILASSLSNVVGILPTPEHVTTTTTTTTVAPPTQPRTEPPGPTKPATEAVTTESAGSSLSTEESNTKVPRNDYWYETTEGIIVLSIFGGGMGLILILAASYICIINRQRLCTCGKGSNLPYDQF